MITINKKEEPSAQPGQPDAITDSSAIEHKSACPIPLSVKIGYLVWGSRQTYSYSNNPARHKCTITNKARNDKRKAKNKMAKLSRRANRRKK